MELRPVPILMGCPRGGPAEESLGYRFHLLVTSSRTQINIATGLELPENNTLVSQNSIKRLYSRRMLMLAVV